ncbi:hypothetical protein [Micromonospora cathayae]|uniref:MYXO-CTERM domain-containing protein n=1 Tax=Micromonospora cathayae TaxID=3028804 RepID=A0ABY7ZT91_9ACTN|nr:hypothetical protein [Micromonospora sp. HUAS 3]WDZ86222.1 hypothetical protein PVK37_07355 [Micromonospora sp. HUAS 3]
MPLFTRLHVALSTHLAELRDESDRGDSPVPTAIIIGGLAVLAAAITVLATSRANLWMNSIPTP